jgi:adenylate cyclase
MLRLFSENFREKIKRILPIFIRVLLPLFFLIAVFTVQIVDPQFRARIREIAFDQLQSIYPLAYQDELPVRVIAIDEASLASLGQWPWPRTVLAQIVDKLTAMGASVVAFDIVMPEADRVSPEQLAAHFSGQPALQALLKKMPSNDTVLAGSFERSRIALGFPIDASAAEQALPPAKARFIVFGGKAQDWLPAYEGAVASLPLLSNVAKGSAAISLPSGSDGVLRAVPLLSQVKGELYPTLGLEVLRLYQQMDNIRVNISTSKLSGKSPGITGVGLGNNIFVPTSADGRAWLHFREFDSKRYISAQDLLAGKVDARQVKGHIVFIGATAKGLGDNITSPLGQLIPGIEGHVQLVEQILSGKTLLRPAWENELLLGFLLASWLLLRKLANYRPVWSVLLGIVLVMCIFAMTGWLFSANQYLLDPLYPSLALSGLFILVMVPRYLQAEMEQRWIKNAFSRYVSPNRVKYLQDNPQQLELGAIYRECTFVMTDLEGFTPLMEKYDPAKLADLINEYLEGMIQIVFKHEGTLDRIVGDAVGVMFSAPLVQTDHAARALACALEMDEFAQECSRRQRAKGIPFGRTRIGVNTGTVLVGNFGGKTMLDYRALGDAINTAARLESINKQLGTRICVSSATVALCSGFIGRPSGQLVLKGKTEAVETFEPLTAAEAAQPQTVEYLAAYKLMASEAAEAADVFSKLAQKYVDDPLANYHAKRLATGAKGCRVIMSSK